MQCDSTDGKKTQGQPPSTVPPHHFLLPPTPLDCHEGFAMPEIDICRARITAKEVAWPSCLVGSRYFVDFCGRRLLQATISDRRRRQRRGFPTCPSHSSRRFSIWGLQTQVSRAGGAASSHQGCLLVWGREGSREVWRRVLVAVSCCWLTPGLPAPLRLQHRCPRTRTLRTPFSGFLACAIYRQIYLSLTIYQYCFEPLVQLLAPAGGFEILSTSILRKT